MKETIYQVTMRTQIKLSNRSTVAGSTMLSYRTVPMNEVADDNQKWRCMGWYELPPSNDITEALAKLMWQVFDGGRAHGKVDTWAEIKKHRDAYHESMGIDTYVEE